MKKLILSSLFLVAGLQASENNRSFRKGSLSGHIPGGMSVSFVPVTFPGGPTSPARVISMRVSSPVNGISPDEFSGKTDSSDGRLSPEELEFVWMVHKDLILLACEESKRTAIAKEAEATLMGMGKQLRIKTAEVLKKISERNEKAYDKNLIYARLNVVQAWEKSTGFSVEVETMECPYTGEIFDTKTGETVL